MAAGRWSILFPNSNVTFDIWLLSHPFIFHIALHFIYHPRRAAKNTRCNSKSHYCYTGSNTILNQSIIIIILLVISIYFINLVRHDKLPATIQNHIAEISVVVKRDSFTRINSCTSWSMQQRSQCCWWNSDHVTQLLFSLNIKTSPAVIWGFIHIIVLCSNKENLVLKMHGFCHGCPLVAENNNMLCNASTLSASGQWIVYGVVLAFRIDKETMIPFCYKHIGFKV